MKRGFSFEMDDIIFKNCYVNSSFYTNGDIRLSIIGNNAITNTTENVVDITLEQNTVNLRKNEIVVDCIYNPTMIPQLKRLGIIKQQTGICVANSNIYPIYSIDFTEFEEKENCMHGLVAA